jgi:quercetin dioxygenase-like cupin family protein
MSRRPLRTALALALAAVLGGCAPRAPAAAAGALRDLDAFLAAHPRAPADGVRVDEVARTADASVHVVQLRRSESPHVHARHDLTVVVLRGRGTLTLGAARLAQRPGDVAFVPRGTVHWFAREGDGDAVALAVFTPPLDGPDTVPAR